MKARWLVVATPPRPADFARPLEAGSDVVEAVSRATEALRKIDENRFDAVACIVESPEDLAVVIRLRRLPACPPVFMVTRSPNPGLRELGRRMGVSEIVSARNGPKATASALLEALATRRLAGEQREEVRKAASLAREIRDLSAEVADRVGAARRLISRTDFTLLLVVAEERSASPLLRAFADAGLPPFLRIFPSAEKAMAYLSGEGEYADRVRHPLPALVLADDRLPGRGGLELLAWMRMRADAASTPFILLGDPPDAASKAEFRDLGLDACCERTGDLLPLIGRIRQVHLRWLLSGGGRLDPGGGGAGSVSG